MFGFKKSSTDASTKSSPERVSEKPEAAEQTRPGFFARLRNKLNRGTSWLTKDLLDLLPGGKIDDAVLDELETRLITADVGVDTTQRILSGLRKQVARSELADLDALLQALRAALIEILQPVARPLHVDAEKKPFVVLVIGVNGAGKTTTIGKLARRLMDSQLKVVLAAGDTFRAAAVEQLQVWGERNGVPVIAQATGADPAAVVFDAYQSAQARGAQVMIADTAGRLHTQSNLMDELKKVKRVLSRNDASAPHELLLVLDASQGQNALQQAKLFHQAVGITGVVVTKLDGTAKGGIVFSLADQLKLPIRFIGIGEGIEDFDVFNAENFVDALLKPTNVA